MSNVVGKFSLSLHLELQINFEWFHLKYNIYLVWPENDNETTHLNLIRWVFSFIFITTAPKCKKFPWNYCFRSLSHSGEEKKTRPVITRALKTSGALDFLIIHSNRKTKSQKLFKKKKNQAEWQRKRKRHVEIRREEKNN